MNINDAWIEAIKTSCERYEAFSHNNSTVKSKILESLNNLVTDCPEALKHKYLILSQRNGNDTWSYHDLKNINHYTNTLNLNCIVQILHNSKNEVIDFRIIKMRDGSPDTFNLILKTYSTNITNYLRIKEGKVEQDISEESDDDYIMNSGGNTKNEIITTTNDEVKVTGSHGGSKFDGAKTKFGLVPPDSLKAVADVMTKGAEKYSANNWVGLELSRVLDAMERHINAFRMGEEYASDSKQHHMAHVIANAMMAYHIVMNKPEQDDRLFKYLASSVNAYDMYDTNSSNGLSEKTKNFYKD